MFHDFDPIPWNVTYHSTLHTILCMLSIGDLPTYINVFCVGGGWEIIIDILNIAAKLHFDR